MSTRAHRLRKRYTLPVPLALIAVTATVLTTTSHRHADAGIREVLSQVTASDGQLHTVTNHLLKSFTVNRGQTTNAGKNGHEYLLVWAGDSNIADTAVSDLKDGTTQADLLSPQRLVKRASDALPGPDFLAVIDADKQSTTYGKVVNTVTVGPLVENEPHHMQYVWHKGDTVFAGGLFTDTTYAFDVSKLPLITLKGVNLPQDTLCGSVPDAYYTLSDGTAYGTYMGGPDAPGPCVYTNDEVRIGNGFGGSPGSIVHLDANGKTLSEVPAASATAEDATRCVNLPAVGPASCANPHGIQVREDLNIMVASDYAEPRNIILDPVHAPNANLYRDTIRTFDIRDRNNPVLRSIGVAPDGPRHEDNPAHEEPRGIMEVAVTHQHNNKGAFASSMCGGVVYYTPDITLKAPKWREVLDDSTAGHKVDPNAGTSGCAGGGWLEVSPDDSKLYRVVIGRNPGTIDTADGGFPKMLYSADVSKLVASKSAPTCSIDDIREVVPGGFEADCPKVIDVQAFADSTSGGPHWGAIDNFEKRKDGTYQETSKVSRIAVTNYFVARTGTDGDHKVCLVDVDPAGKLALDKTFVDENTGTPCVSFNRNSWPHGVYGNAKPHSQLFVVADDHLRD